MDVVVIGSSHVKRLQSYMQSKPELKNFNLNNVNVKTHLYGISGGNITNSRDVKKLNSFINTVGASPKCLIIQIGGNDMDSLDITPQEVIFKLIAMAQVWKVRYNFKQVFVCQLLPREVTRVVQPSQYNENVREANKLLKAELSRAPNSAITYWKIKGVKKSMDSNYVDGVHFNWQFGMPKYFRNIRGAILTAIRHN